MSACGLPTPQRSDGVDAACRPRGASVALAGRGVAEELDASAGNVALRTNAQPDDVSDAQPDTLPDAKPDVRPEAVPDAVPDDPPDAVPDAVPDGQTNPTSSPTLQPGAAPERDGSSRLRARPASPLPRRAASAQVRARNASPPPRRPTLRGAYVSVPSGGRVVWGGGGASFDAGPDYEEVTRILDYLYGMSAEEEAAWEAESEAAWLAEISGDGGAS